MIQGIGYRKKLMLSIYGAFFLLLVAYFFGIRKSINARRELLLLKEQSGIISQSASLKAELEMKLVELNNDLGDVHIVDDDQEFILNTIHNCKVEERVRVIEVTGTTSQTDNGITRSTFGATIEGNFADLVRLTRAFENSGHEGRIASATYFRYVDSKIKKTATRLKIYIQEYSTE